MQAAYDLWAAAAQASDAGLGFDPNFWAHVEKHAVVYTSKGAVVCMGIRVDDVVTRVSLHATAELRCRPVDVCDVTGSVRGHIVSRPKILKMWGHADLAEMIVYGNSLCTFPLQKLDGGLGIVGGIVPADPGDCRSGFVRIAGELTPTNYPGFAVLKHCDATLVKGGASGAALCTAARVCRAQVAGINAEGEVVCSLVGAVPGWFAVPYYVGCARRQGARQWRRPARGELLSRT